MTPTLPAAPKPAASSLTIGQANLLVAMLGGFWGRQADGPPGPDLFGRGLVILAWTVCWQRLQFSDSQSQPRGKDPPDAAGRRPRTAPRSATTAKPARK